MKWLMKKFKLLKKSLKERNIINSDASSSNYVKIKTAEIAVDDGIFSILCILIYHFLPFMILVDWITETTLGIISEYVSLELYEKLEKCFGSVKKINDKLINKGKRKSEMINPDILPDLKKIKGDIDVPTPVKSKKVVTKEKAFKKAAKGSKNISSFFTNPWLLS